MVGGGNPAVNSKYGVQYLTAANTRICKEWFRGIYLQSTHPNTQENCNE